MSARDPFSRRAFIGRTAAMGAAAVAGSFWKDAPKQAMAAAAVEDHWQIGCYTRPWAKYDYRVAMDAIAEAGMKHVGLMTANTPSGLVISVQSTVDEAVRAGAEAKKRGLKIPSLYGGGVNVQTRELAVADLRRLIDLSAAAGARTLLAAGIGTPREYDIYFGAIADCCDYAAEKMVGLAIKPHGGLNATGPQLRKAIEKVNHQNFTVWYDAGNVLYYSDGKLDPVDDAAAVDGLVAGWCIKDYRSPKQVDVTPGAGQVDFRAVFARLRKGGFRRGPLVVETLSPGELPQLTAEAKKARQFLEAMIRG